MPDAKLQVLTLWSPILPRDNKAGARNATAFLDDPRVEHYWDLWSYGLRGYTQVLKYPRQAGTAWDVYMLYEPHVSWDGNMMPEPTSWYQNRRLSYGEHYSQGAIAADLKRLVSGTP